MHNWGKANIKNHVLNAVSSLFRGRKTTHVWRLRGSEALARNHLQLTHQAVVGGADKGTMGGNPGWILQL